MQENGKNDSDNNSSPRPVRDKVTKDKIDRHLRDIDDTISEEDIKNINTSLTGNNVSRAEKDADDASAGAESGREDTAPKKEMPNTWDIVDE